MWETKEEVHERSRGNIAKNTWEHTSDYERYPNDQEPVVFYPEKADDDKNVRHKKGLKGKVHFILKEGSSRWRKAKRGDSIANDSKRKKNVIKNKKALAEF